MIRCKIVKLALSYSSNLICAKYFQKLRQTVRKALCKACSTKNDSTKIASFYWFVIWNTAVFQVVVKAATVKYFKCHLDMINTDKPVSLISNCILQWCRKIRAYNKACRNGKMVGWHRHYLYFTQLWAFYSKEKEIPNRGFV